MSDVDPAFPGRPTVTALTAALRVYREARKLLLATLNLPMSNRDPLAEWAEHFVAAVTGGMLEGSRVHPTTTSPPLRRRPFRFVTWPIRRRLGSTSTAWR